MEELTNVMGRDGKHPRVTTNLWKDKKERRYHLSVRDQSHRHHIAVMLGHCWISRVRIARARPGYDPTFKGRHIYTEYRGKEAGREVNNRPILWLGYSQAVSHQNLRLHDNIKDAVDLEWEDCHYYCHYHQQPIWTNQKFWIMLRNDNNAYKGRVAINLQVLFVVVVLHVPTCFDYVIRA
jgi:hypothetical protein